jgi:hypothetical protein
MSQKATLRYGVSCSFVTLGTFESLKRRGSLPPCLFMAPEDPMSARRISPVEVWSRLQARPAALLVSADDDEEKCAGRTVRGSLSLRALSDCLGALPKDQEIVFYCG